MNRHDPGDSRPDGPRRPTGAEIGTSDSCDHETLQRIGSDGGNNLYFRCANCSGVTVKFGSQQSQYHDRSELVADDERSHPLIETLAKDLDRSENGNSDAGRETSTWNIRGSLRKIFSPRKKN